MISGRLWRSFYLFYEIAKEKLLEPLGKFPLWQLVFAFSLLNIQVKLLVIVGKLGLGLTPSPKGT